MQPLVKRYKKFTTVVSILVIADVLLYAFGIFTPFLTLKKFFIFNETVSLVSSIKILFAQQQTSLAVIITLFSIIFPIIKLLIVLLIWFVIKSDANIIKWLHRVEVVGNWSMLDVFVVAISVVAIKLSGLGSMQVHYGLYLFAASVILTKINLIIIYKMMMPKNKKNKNKIDDEFTL